MSERDKPEWRKRRMRAWTHENLKPGFVSAIDGLLKTLERLELAKDAKVETSGAFGGIYWARVKGLDGGRYDGKIHAINNKWWTSTW